MRASSSLALAGCLVGLASAPAWASLKVGSVGTVSRDWLATNAGDVDKQVAAALRANAFDGLVAPQAITEKLGAWVDAGEHAFADWPAAIVAAVAELDPALGRWQVLGSGQHSFRRLDRSMYVECQMTPVPEGEASLLFFNFALAARLGLHVPEDPTKLAKLVIRSFAWRTAACGDAIGTVAAPPSLEPALANASTELAAIAAVPRTMIATRYQDSGGKDPMKDALGDGRAVWAGELPGHPYVDVLIKGVGKTSLEWRGHSSPAHSDGLQSLGEGVHSYMISMINEANGIDTTRDLALIKLDNLIKNDEERNTHDPATITVRAGQQMRMGHLEYWTDSAARFADILGYAIRRSRAIDRVPVARDFEDYFRGFAERSGRDAARLYYLHSFHASATRGNRTTEGLFIDNGTWNYLDAHHGQFQTGAFSHGAQAANIREYLNNMLTFVKKTGYLEQLGLEASPIRHEVRRVFDDAYRAALKPLMLRRLGYTDGDIIKILELLDEESQTALLDAYVTAAKAVYDAAPSGGMDGPVKVPIMGKDTAPARFNARRMILGIVRYVGQFGDRPVVWQAPMAPEAQATMVGRLAEASRADFMTAFAGERDVPAWTLTSPRAAWEPDLAVLCTPEQLDRHCATLLKLAGATYALTQFLYARGIKMQPALIEQRNQPRSAAKRARQVLWEAYDQTIRNLPLAERDAAILRAGAPYLD